MKYNEVIFFLQNYLDGINYVLEMYFLNLPFLLRCFIHVCLYHLFITWHVDVVAYAHLKLLWSLYTARVASRKYPVVA